LILDVFTDLTAAMQVKDRSRLVDATPAVRSDDTVSGGCAAQSLTAPA
jgi:hypothetical protein